MQSTIQENISIIINNAATVQINQRNNLNISRIYSWNHIIFTAMQYLNVIDCLIVNNYKKYDTSFANTQNFSRESLYWIFTLS